MKKVIFLVEDDLFLSKLSKKKFELAGFEVEYFKNGNQVLDSAKNNQPAVIILDLLMPEKDGFQVLKELRENIETKDVPVLVVTAVDSYEDREKTAALGAKGYFVKGTAKLEDVIAAVEQFSN
ncbi:MAG: hypothetical protein COU63_01275 [Candidatus Pacebacteria bacterium CG10_big_fil_rev_8_21_14_0_10_36_11]|nr:response regulator [Candidatus Pacearchaeota archaeon]OIP73781.1 MAG: hypothetical protein AUK08_04445 [Candidatus Pacebacteria bacterium CG2_30_36_39]PIR64633.1 MAG: hypothetical protein COU63_01275 [Candidatus Pacebacteria bacterium CG10_big_fil_rev_8_21_14_0_10_36_11]PJC43014.1 MAG: hypothetical protein CO040_01375 [Candidatus Pacebacteria bacterium CG_4_9_14_0_2_um_filter_36_8]